MGELKKTKLKSGDHFKTVNDVRSPKRLQQTAEEKEKQRKMKEALPQITPLHFDFQKTRCTKNSNMY